MNRLRDFIYKVRVDTSGDRICDECYAEEVEYAKYLLTKQSNE